MSHGLTVLQSDGLRQPSRSGPKTALIGEDLEQNGVERALISPSQLPLSQMLAST